MRLLVDEGKVPTGPEGRHLDRYIHAQNLAHFRRLLAEPDVAKDWDRHKLLLKLLAEEEAKDKRPPDVRPPT
jgi:hypothetical protein